jgi:hypothetical protein
MVGRATLPIGLSFGALGPVQIYVKSPGDPDHVDETEGLTDRPRGQSRGRRAFLTCRCMTVLQPAPDAGLDAHREPVPPGGLFLTETLRPGACPKPPRAPAFSRLRIIHEVVWLNSGVCKNELSAGLNVQLVLRSGNKGHCQATVGSDAGVA